LSSHLFRSCRGAVVTRAFLVLYLVTRSRVGIQGPVLDVTHVPALAETLRSESPVGIPTPHFAYAASNPKAECLRESVSESHWRPFSGRERHRLRLPRGLANKQAAIRLEPVNLCQSRVWRLKAGPDYLRLSSPLREASFFWEPGVLPKTVISVYARLSAFSLLLQKKRRGRR